MEYKKFMEIISKNNFSEEDAKQGGISFLGSQRDLESGVSIVENNETPIGIVAGEFYFTGPGTPGVNNAIVILTNERLIKADKKIKNTDFSYFYISDINSVVHETSFLSSSLRIKTTSGTISIRKVRKDTGKKFNSELNKLLRDVKKKNTSNKIINKELSGMDEIRKAKKLLDEKIISKKEFDAIKAKYL